MRHRLVPFLAITLLFLASIGGAVVEGLWRDIPAVLVQVNGLLLLASALCLLTLGGRVLLDIPRGKAVADVRPGG